MVQRNVNKYQNILISHAGDYVITKGLVNKCKLSKESGVMHVLLEWPAWQKWKKNEGRNQLIFSPFCSLFTECNEWHACNLCTTGSFEEFPGHVASDGNKTQR